MATTTKAHRRIVRDILDTLSDYPNEARDEVLDELIGIAVREEELTSMDADLIRTLIWARS
jgi:hypothetical protein